MLKLLKQLDAQIKVLTFSLANLTPLVIAFNTGSSLATVLTPFASLFTLR